MGIDRRVMIKRRLKCRGLARPFCKVKNARWVAEVQVAVADVDAVASGSLLFIKDI